MKVYSILVDINGFMKMQKAQSITYNNIFRFVAKYLIKDYLHIELLEANDQFAAFFDATKKRNPNDPIFRMNVEATKEHITPQLDKVQKGEHVRFLAKLRNQEGKTVLIKTNGDYLDWIEGIPGYLIIYNDVTDLTEFKEMQKQPKKQKQQATGCPGERTKGQCSQSGFSVTYVPRNLHSHERHYWNDHHCSGSHR